MAREDVIQSAVRFLKDPKVQESPLTKRIAFLETKGLTNEEIELALQRSGTSNGTSGAVTTTTTVQTGQQVPGYPASGAPMGYGMIVQAPIPQPYTWKDYALGTIGAVGAGYGIYSLVKTYVLPHLLPTTESLASSTQELTTHLTASNNVLNAIQAETAAVLAAVETQTQKVTQALDDMQTVIGDIKKNEENREKDIEQLKKDVESVRDLVPVMLEKQASSQSSLITDLQSEIKSLKSLLLNRRIPINANGTPASDGTPSPSGDSTPASSALPAGVSRGLPNIPFKPSIPAWQLAQQQQETADAKNEPEGQKEANEVKEGEAA
ncbi:peroxisomal membrane protein pex14 [Gaertneriomyces sp. JEL0708]|nr:peroxisomal membrane protein pex14 [Gaertneriomyces sp. JEL0708]